MSIERAARAMWESLKERRCSDPERAMRIVMLSEDDCLPAAKAALQSQWRDFDPEDKATWPDTGDNDPRVWIRGATLATGGPIFDLAWFEDGKWQRSDGSGHYYASSVTRYMPIPQGKE